jgi:hypothetical protein
MCKVARSTWAWEALRLGRVMWDPRVWNGMSYELTAICDGCGVCLSLRLDSFGQKFPDRPLPAGWTHVHQGGVPGTVTPEIGIACSRACLSKARRTLLARGAQKPARRRREDFRTKVE